MSEVLDDNNNNNSPSSHSPDDPRPSPPPQDPPHPSGEYEAGRVICQDCGGGISIRDQSTNDFTVKHWEAHRLSCPAAPTAPPPERDPVIFTPPDSTPDALTHPPAAKRRRAKRTEEERIEYLRADPYVAQFEAYRVLCASCHKWIRLRPNSTYCSIPWDAHRKSCLAKKVNSKNVYALEERNNLFGKDPDVRKFDAERVLCNLCDKWIDVPSSDHLQAVQKWLQHRADCQKPSSSPPKQPKPAPPAAAAPEPPRRPSPPNSPSFHDINPVNFPLPHESRRRNAEQRAATLRADKLIGEVEPNRVFCLLCQKWVQLRQDSSYCAYPWIQHRNKCEKRHQRHERKVAERLAAKRPLSDSDDSDDLESEDADEDRSRRKHPKDVERYIAWLRSGDRSRPRISHHSPHYPPPPPGSSSRQQHQQQHHHHHHHQPHHHHQHQQHQHQHQHHQQPSRRRSCDVDVDAEGDIDAEGELEDSATANNNGSNNSNNISRFVSRRPLHPVGLADLDSPAGRRAFISASVSYLFATTYESSDDMSISALLTYLNAAMPQDKHEDFDTTEVVKAVTALHERGRVLLQGDILRLCD